jgi:flagellar biosynthesis chaperone FliJ
MAKTQESESAARRGVGHRPRRAIETIDDALAHLAESLTQLADYIREHQHDLDVDEMARLCAVRGQNLNRFVRMLRDKAALQGGSDDQLCAEIQQALKLASEILGVEL